MGDSMHSQHLPHTFFFFNSGWLFGCLLFWGVLCLFAVGFFCRFWRLFVCCLFVCLFVDFTVVVVVAAAVVVWGFLFA